MFLIINTGESLATVVLVAVDKYCLLFLLRGSDKILPYSVIKIVHVINYHSKCSSDVD